MHAMARGDVRQRLDITHAATAGGEEDKVLGEDGGAVVPAAATAESLPGADDAALDVLAEGHAREMGMRVSDRYQGRGNGGDGLRTEWAPGTRR